MKPFDELSDAEILALTDEQVEYYIDRTCAEQGVALVPPTPPSAPTQPPVENDVTAYAVAGLLFASTDDAERVRAMLVTCKSRLDSDYLSRGYRRYVKPATDTIDVTVQHYLSEQAALSQRDAIGAHDEAKQAYQKERSAFDEAVRGRDRVASSIRATVSRVREEDEDRREHQREFDRYVALADGDRRMAWRFLCRVRSRAERLLPDLAAELGGPDVVHSQPEPVAVGDDIAF